MGATFQSVEGMLNLSWGLVSLGTLLLSWRCRGTREHKRALAAILFLLVLLFPVVSTADDLAQQAMMYDPSPSPLTLLSANEFKQILAPALPACQAGLGLTHPLPEAVGESLEPESISRGPFLLLSSASGIHSPPQF